MTMQITDNPRRQHERREDAERVIEIFYPAGYFYEVVCVRPPSYAVKVSHADGRFLGFAGTRRKRGSPAIFSRPDHDHAPRDQDGQMAGPFSAGRRGSALFGAVSFATVLPAVRLLAGDAPLPPASHRPLRFAAGVAMLLTAILLFTAVAIALRTVGLF